MEIQFEKQVLRYLKPVIQEVQEQEKTQEIRLGDGLPDAGSVICAWGQVVLRSKEWRSDSLTASGGIQVWLLYAPEDGSQPRCLEEWIPFRFKWDIPEGKREGDMRVKCLLRFADGRTISPRKLMIRCGLAARMEALSPEEAETGLPAEQTQGMQLLKRTYPVLLPVEAGEKTFQLDEELTLPASCPKAAEILACRAHVALTERKVIADKAVFRGNGVARILYRAEDGQLHAWDFELPFSQFAQLQGEYGADVGLDVIPEVTALETELDGEGKFRIRCGLVGQYRVDARRNLELAEDAYCPGRELSIQMGHLELPSILEQRTDPLQAEQSLPMDADCAVDAAFYPDFPRTRRTGEGLELELSGMFQVLCSADGGRLQSGTTRWEHTMQLPADREVHLTADLATNDVQADLVEGRVAVSAGLSVKTESISGTAMPMVTGLSMGQAAVPDPERPSLILRRAGKEDLWNLAKRYGSTMAAIQEANGLEGEPPREQMLLIPVM